MPAVYGKVWTKYTARDGLMDGIVLSIVQAEDGTLYFSGSHKGKAAVTRYDGRTWRIYTEADGLVGNHIGEASAIDTRMMCPMISERPTRTRRV